MPGQGKTSAVRVLVAAAALDPSVEMWLHELKGTGDLDPFEQVSHRFISGIDDESIAYAAESLKMLRAEVMRRAARLKKLDRALCPDKKVTREIANKRSLHLWPLLAAFDELQNLFAHPKYGKQAGEDAVFVIKIGRALGVFLILATQRPDKESLPTGVSGNVSTRFCLKVAGQVENDMILGTSAYKNGARATTFRPKVDAGLGYLKGEENAPRVVRTYYLNGADTERVAKRARASARRPARCPVWRSAAMSARSAGTCSPTRPRRSVTRLPCTGPSWPPGSPSGSPSGGRTPHRTRCRRNAGPGACPAWSSRQAASGAAAAAGRPSRPRAGSRDPLPGQLWRCRS